MKAAAIDSFGGPEVVELLEVETPAPGPGEVRVRVKAAGIQASDCAVRGGWTPPGQTLSFPQKIGNEFAGVVDQIGEGADGFDIGSEVLGWAMLAGHAEYLVVPTDQIVAKPAAMPWTVAGVLSASGQTAHTALDRLKVGKGDTLLVHAAAGGVGTVAVQLARAYGANVVGTASPRNHDYLRSLGAVPVEYGAGLVQRVRQAAPQGVTAILDGAGGEALDASVELLDNRDRIGTLVGFERVEELGILALFSQRSTERLQELVELHTQGKLRIEIARTFGLAEAADAHREVETRHVRGKVAIVMD
ncbi:NADP-dependent oxidoreductase [Streptomyces sparsus]